MTRKQKDNYGSDTLGKDEEDKKKGVGRGLCLPVKLQRIVNDEVTAEESLACGHPLGVCEGVVSVPHVEGDGAERGQCLKGSADAEE